MNSKISVLGQRFDFLICTNITSTGLMRRKKKPKDFFLQIKALDKEF